MGYRVCRCGNLTKNKVRCDSCNAKWKRYYRSTSKQKNKHWYGYDWQQLRESYLDDNPQCELCSAAGFIEEAREVHHKVPISDAPQLRLEWSNLQALCVSCHRKEDARIDAQQKMQSQLGE